MGSRRPARKGPQDYTGATDFYGASAPATPPGGAWPPPPLWRPAMQPITAPTPPVPDDPFPVPGARATAPPLGERRRRYSRKHWVGYPLTALAALTAGLMGAAPGGASPEVAAPVSQPSPAPAPTTEPVRRLLEADPTTNPNCTATKPSQQPESCG
jgi:hypothetical protein